MTALIIGISSGLLTIIIFVLLKQFDKKLVYGLILTGIGFLYVGFAWMNLQALIVNCAQAIFFLFFAYYGVKKGFYLLAAGYFLHGTWDIVYHLFQDTSLIPPDYNLFCMSIDYIIGFYLLWIGYRAVNKTDSLKSEV